MPPFLGCKFDNRDYFVRQRCDLKNALGNAAIWKTHLATLRFEKRIWQRRLIATFHHFLPFFSVWFGVLFIRQGVYQDAIFRFKVYIPDNYPDGDCPVKKCKKEKKEKKGKET
jgi:hypothetical protein